MSNQNEKDSYSIENGIARHISFYYCQLDKQNCEENSLTNYIFIHGSLALKRAFLSEAKNQLKNNDGGKKVFSRLKELIDWRYEVLGKVNFTPYVTAELSGFFFLFPITVKFDSEWSLKYLSEFMSLLKTNGKPYYPDLIIDSLIEQADVFPLLTAQCLLSWVKNMDNSWYDFNDVNKLILSLHSHDDKETNTILIEVVSRLSAKGICRDLIKLFSNMPAGENERLLNCTQI